MATVAEHLAENLTHNLLKRLKGLKEIKAPDIMISQLEQNLEVLQHNDALTAVSLLVACKDLEILSAEFISSEARTGKGGKSYGAYETSVGQVNYFPFGKFGRFIAYPKTI